jgi:hypothetical protein
MMLSSLGEGHEWRLSNRTLPRHRLERGEISNGGFFDSNTNPQCVENKRGGAEKARMLMITKGIDLHCQNVIGNKAS